VESVHYIALCVRLQMDSLKTKFDCAAVEEIRDDGKLRWLETVGAAAKITRCQLESDWREVDITGLRVKRAIHEVNIS
jgi:hypothetical protein